MIQSMTGYGKSSQEIAGQTIHVELKSLNSKNLDVNFRASSKYREIEIPLRNKIAEVLKRGKVDVSLYVESKSGEASAVINTKVVESYIKQLQEIQPDENKDFSELLAIVMKFPEALSTDKTTLEKDEIKAIESTLEEALQTLVKHRLDEGKALEADFKLRIDNLKSLVKEVISIDPERIENVRERLHKAVDDLKTNVDENRFEQELVYYIEKYDITEEKIRLENHLDYFSKNIDTKDSNGKKLNFICQEIGREINTIGSKSNYAPMQKLVVKMKDELEKIKEQLLNVL